MCTYAQAGRQASPPKRGVPVTPEAEEEAQHLHGGTAVQWSRTGSESPESSVLQQGAAPLPLQETSFLRQGTKVLSAAEKSNSSSCALEYEKRLTPQKMLSEMRPVTLTWLSI